MLQISWGFHPNARPMAVDNGAYREDQQWCNSVMEGTPATLADIILYCKVELQEMEPNSSMPGSMGEPIQHP